MDISTGKGSEKGGEREGAKTEMEENKTGLRETVKREEGGVRGSRDGDGRDGEKLQVEGGRLGAG